MAKDRTRTEWKSWIPRLENENSKKPIKKRGRAKTQNDRGRKDRERKKEEGEETRRGGNREQGLGKAQHYFNVFALKLDVGSCPGLLPGIQRAGIDLEVDVIHE